MMHIRYEQVPFARCGVSIADLEAAGHGFDAPTTCLWCIAERPFATFFTYETVGEVVINEKALSKIAKLELDP